MPPTSIDIVTCKIHLKFKYIYCAQVLKFFLFSSAKTKSIRTLIKQHCHNNGVLLNYFWNFFNQLAVRAVIRVTLWASKLRNLL